MILVSPQDIPQHWGFVEPGLNQILLRTKESWSPTHIRQAINEGWASLFVCEDGFCVLQRLKAAWTSEPYINVWAMWFKPCKAKEKRQELIAWLDQVTKSERCLWWEFASPREGWSGIEPDCERVKTIWRRKT